MIDVTGATSVTDILNALEGEIGSDAVVEVDPSTRRPSLYPLLLQSQLIQKAYPQLRMKANAAATVILSAFQRYYPVLLRPLTQYVEYLETIARRLEDSGGGDNDVVTMSLADAAVPLTLCECAKCLRALIDINPDLKVLSSSSETVMCLTHIVRYSKAEAAVGEVLRLLQSIGPKAISSLQLCGPALIDALVSIPPSSPSGGGGGYNVPPLDVCRTLIGLGGIQTASKIVAYCGDVLQANATTNNVQVFSACLMVLRTLFRNSRGIPLDIVAECCTGYISRYKQVDNKSIGIFTEFIHAARESLLAHAATNTTTMKGGAGVVGVIDLSSMISMAVQYVQSSSTTAESAAIACEVILLSLQLRVSAPTATSNAIKPEFIINGLLGGMRDRFSTAPKIPGYIINAIHVALVRTVHPTKHEKDAAIEALVMNGGVRFLLGALDLNANTPLHVQATMSVLETLLFIASVHQGTVYLLDGPLLSTVLGKLCFPSTQFTRLGLQLYVAMLDPSTIPTLPPPNLMSDVTSCILHHCDKSSMKEDMKLCLSILLQITQIRGAGKMISTRPSAIQDLRDLHKVVTVTYPDSLEITVMYAKYIAAVTTDEVSRPLLRGGVASAVLNHLTHAASSLFSSSLTGELSELVKLIQANTSL